MKKIIYITPIFPATGGIANMTRRLLKFDDFKKRVIHMDISDRRSISTQGRIDIFNVWQGITQILQLIWLLIIRYRMAKGVYLILPYKKLGMIKFIFFCIISKLFRKKIIAHYRNRYYFRKMIKSSNWFEKKLFLSIVNLIDQILILWPDVYQTDFEGLVSKNKVSVLGNGIDYQTYRPKNTDLEKRFNDQKIKIIFLGELTEQKGIDFLLKAFLKTKKEIPSLELQLLGDISTVNTKLCKKLLNNPSSGITFTGIKTGNEKKKLLVLADIFTLPSLHEGMSNSVLEAMASGLPVVVSNRGSAQHFIKKKNGFVVSIKNEKELAKAFLVLAKNKVLRKEMMENNLQLIKKFDINQVVNKTINIFDQL